MLPDSAFLDLMHCDLGLTHLTLHCKVWTDAAPIDLPFRLTHLVLGGSYFPLRFIDALFESLHETLVDLVLTLRTQQSPTLRRLIADRVATCTHLITLSDSTRGSQDLLDLLLPELLLSLEVLNVSFGDKNRIHELARRFSLANLPRLRYLRFMYLSLNNIRGSAEGNQMLRYCRISGVQVLFGFELDYLREEVCSLWTVRCVCCWSCLCTAFTGGDRCSQDLLLNYGEEELGGRAVAGGMLGESGGARNAPLRRLSRNFCACAV